MDGCILCFNSRSHQLVGAKARCFYNPLLLFFFFFGYWSHHIDKVNKLFSSQNTQT